MDYRTFGNHQDISRLISEGKITNHKEVRTGNTNMPGKWHLVFTGPGLEVWLKSKRGDAAFMTLDRIYDVLQYYGFKKLEINIPESLRPNVSHLNMEFREPKYRRPYRHHRSKKNI